jgi:glyoxylase-like metal-dependent hydrolase (beta-lactamase superfamily II)
MNRRDLLTAFAGGTTALTGLAALSGCASLSSAEPAPRQEMFKLVKLNRQAYALVGELGQRSPSNLGNNMTCGFLVGDDAVALIDTGGSQAGAQAIERAVRSVSQHPIRWAINTGGQDHRWFGNAYFQSRHGTQIVAAQQCLEDQRARGFDQMNQAKSLLGQAGFAGTELAYPDQVFQGKWTLPLRGLQAHVIYSGGAHTHGDSWVWLPEQRTVFSGDAVYSQRLLGLQPKLGIRWIAALERLRDELAPLRIVPGHGDVCDLPTALKDSLAYLHLLRDGSRKLIKAGAFDPLEIAEQLDQSTFSYLDNYRDGRFRRLNAYRMAEEVMAASP